MSPDDEAALRVIAEAWLRARDFAVREPDTEVRLSDAPVELTLTRGDERATAWVFVARHP
jgi:hypothetical protein